jgi:hypothetical protein
MRFFKWLAAALIVVASVPALAAKADYTRENVAKVDCDKRCLMVILNQVLDAIGDNSTAGLPIAQNAKITSNGTVGKIESSPVWGPARRIPYRLVFADPVTATAVFYGVVTNNYDRPAGAPPANRKPPEGAGNLWLYYVLRIKVANHKITELEQLDLEPKQGFGSDAIRNLHQADRIWDTVIPSPNAPRAKSCLRWRTSTGTWFPSESTRRTCPGAPRASGSSPAPSPATPRRSRGAAATA